MRQCGPRTDVQAHLHYCMPMYYDHTYEVYIAKMLACLDLAGTNSNSIDTCSIYKGTGYIHVPQIHDVLHGSPILSKTFQMTTHTNI